MDELFKKLFEKKDESQNEEEKERLTDILKDLFESDDESGDGPTSECVLEMLKVFQKCNGISGDKLDCAREILKIFEKDDEEGQTKRDCLEAMMKRLFEQCKSDDKMDCIREMIGKIFEKNGDEAGDRKENLFDDFLGKFLKKKESADTDERGKETECLEENMDEEGKDRVESENETSGCLSETLGKFVESNFGLDFILKPLPKESEDVKEEEEKKMDFGDFVKFGVECLLKTFFGSGKDRSRRCQSGERDSQKESSQDGAREDDKGDK